MDEKKYKEAVDEIKADEKLKQDTLNKMKQDKKPKMYLKLVSIAAVVMIVFSVSFVGIRQYQNTTTTKKEEKVAIADNEMGIPQFESKKELRNYLKERDDYDERYYIYDDVDDDGGTEPLEIFSAKGETASDSMSQYSKETSIGNDTESLDYSKTNTQVEGVDEADIIKTDGKYIYYLSRKNDKILIINAQTLKIEGKITDMDEDLDSTISPIEIYVLKDKLIVIAEGWYDNYKDYYSDCYYYLDTDSTCALVYDISDKKDIELERRVEIDGEYLTSRMIDDNLYFVAQKYVYYYKDIKDREIIPYYTDTVISDDEKELPIDCIYYFPETEEHTYINVVGFNINDEEEASIETFIGASSNIYSSEDYLYLTKSNYNYKRSKKRTTTEASTDIYKLKLKDGNVSLKAKGTVNGTTLNQFSMDEYKGNLRIATTSYNNYNETENNIYVLDEELNEIGSVEDLATDESIYSVRFMGKTGYVVTFKQVDPLFVIDLSDPEAPEVKGKLKIPGYSSYLHPYDDTHIIGIGKNTEETQYGSTVNTNMKMSMFDVSDLENPKELFSVSIGGKGTTSEILDNHKALFFNKEKNLIGFPITIYDENEGYYSYKTKMQGAIIYEIDFENNQFKEKGTISLRKEENGFYSYDYSKALNRIIYIEDKIYALSDSMMKVVNIDTLEEIGELEY